MGHVIGSGLFEWTGKKMCFRVWQRGWIVVLPKGNGIWNPKTHLPEARYLQYCPFQKFGSRMDAPQKCDLSARVITPKGVLRYDKSHKNVEF